jgi:hypothetical protein
MVKKTEFRTFKEFLKTIDPQLQGICSKLRDNIITLDPDYVELVWKNQGIASYGMGPKKMSEHYVYIAPQKNYVNLGFYHGTSLSNPKGLLEGTGKRLRHIKIKSEDETRDRKIKDLITEAIAEIKSSLS